MANISPVAAFNPEDPDLSRWVSAMKTTIGSIGVAIDELDADLSPLKSFLTQIEQILEDFKKEKAILQAIQTQVNTALAEAKALVLQVSTLRTDIDANTAAISVLNTAVTNLTASLTTIQALAQSAKNTADTAKTAADSALTRVNVIRTRYVENLEVGLDNRLRFNISTNGTVGSQNTLIPTQPDWNQDTSTSDDYIKNRPTTITPEETTLLNRFPTDTPPNANVLIGDGTGNLIYRNLDAATIPIQSFHYLDYDHATGMAIERYAEDTETVTIDPLIEYQPGFVQNEFRLDDEGVLSYIG